MTDPLTDVIDGLKRDLDEAGKRIRSLDASNKELKAENRRLLARASALSTAAHRAIEALSAVAPRLAAIIQADLVRAGQ